MKIDSPTFLSETTFISASVQFSSGSQKFGNTTDDQHQFTGSLKIGGNSFFREIGSGHQVYIDSDAGGVSQIGTNTYTPLSIRANGNQAIYISQGAQVTINNLIGTAAYMGSLTSTGDIIGLGTNGVISGSSTSTGSFGRVELHGASNTNSTISVKDGVNNGILRLEGSTRVANPGSYIQLYGPNGSYGSAVFNYGYNQTNSELSFTVDGSERIRFGGLGEIEARSITTTHNISGSATSTGSFGAGFFADTVGMGVAPGNSSYFLNIEASQTYAARFKSRKTTTSTSQRTMIAVGSGQDKGAGIFFQGPGTNLSIGVKDDNKFHIAPGLNDIGDGSSNSVTVDTSGNLEVISGNIIASGNISGSATSTGSFGMVHTEGIKGLNGNYTGTLFVPEILALGNDTDTMIRKYTSNVLEFRMGGQDLIRFDGNNGQVFIENANLVLDSGKNVSGSATSTGSFGRVETNEIAHPQANSRIDVKSQLFLKPQADGSQGIIASAGVTGNQFIDFYNYGSGDAYVKMRGATGGKPYYQWMTSPRIYTFAMQNSTGGQGLYLLSGSIDKIGSYNHRIFGIDDNSGALYGDGLSMRFSGNAVWSHRTTAQPTFQIISDDTSGNITGQHISGSAQTTASFGRLILPSVNSSANPTLAFGDGNTGFYENGDNGLSIAIAGNRRWYFAADTIYGNDSGGPAIMAKTATATQPVFGIRGDENTGIGSSGADTISIIGGGKENLRVSSTLVSGSATSTGSFASLVVADAIQGSTTIKGGDFIPRGRLTTGANSVVIGSSAYKLGTAGDRNVVIGENAAGFNSMNGSVDDSVFIGYRAAANATSNYYNVAIGSTAMYSNKTGHGNVAIGYGALYTEGARGSNVAIGYNALNKQSGSAGIESGNTAIGANAGEDATTATRMVIIGTSAGKDITTGGYGTMVGWRAGYTTTTGASNTFIGNYSGYSNITGYSNVALGGSSMDNGTKASNSVGIGLSALGYLGHTIEKEYTVAIGNLSGQYATGSYNTFVGGKAGRGGTTSAPYSSGQYNVALGTEALTAFTTGGSNVAIGYQAADAFTTAGEAVAIGRSALGSATTQGRNVAIGYFSAATLTGASAQYNVFVGDYTGQGGSGNLKRSVAIGYQVLQSTAGNDVDGAIGIGYQALNDVTSGDQNIAIGYQAGDGITTTAGTISIGAAALGGITTTGDYTIAIGHGAMGGAEIGDGNIAIGYQSMQNANAAGFHRNIAIGYQTMANVGSNSAADNIAIGYQALNDINGSALGNVAIGSYSGDAITSGDYNVSIGENALASVNTGGSNIGIGRLAGANTTTINLNTYIGYAAGHNNQTGGYNTIIGNESYSQTSGIVNFAYVTTLGGEAGRYATGSYNTFIGAEAGLGGTTSAPFSSGENNTALGYQALKGFTTAHDNVAIGFQSAAALTTGHDNVAIGRESLEKGTSTYSNVAIGYRALQDATTDAVHAFTAIGKEAARDVTDAEDCVAIGSGAGQKIAGDDVTVVGQSAGQYSAGGLNTFVGHTAGKGDNGNTTGTSNTAIGKGALVSFTTGNYNTAMGSMVMDNITTGTNNIGLGFNIDTSAVDVTFEYVIGSGQSTSGAHAFDGAGTETIRIGKASDYITNDFGENATWTHSSDKRVKKDIKDNELGLEFISKLRTRNFKKKAPSEYPKEFKQYDSDITERKNPNKIHYGFVAQEVKEVMDEIGHSEFPVWKENRDGMQELGETELITPLVKAVQELTEMVKAQQKEIEELKNK